MSIFRNQRHTTSTAIPSTTCRPYRLGSRKRDVTRKYDVYVFETWRLCA